MTTISYSQEPTVYRLSWIEHNEKVIRIVSLSDKYQQNQNPDSLAVPRAYLDERSGLADVSFQLNGKYRDRCLKAVNISEDDIVYIYDYATDQLLRFYVKGLNLIGVLTPYSSGAKYPVSPHDYMIGFEVKPSYLTSFKDYYSHVLVAIGKANPFTRGMVKPIHWTRVDSTHFPVNAVAKKQHQFLSKSAVGTTYQFKMNGMTYFVQNIGQGAFRANRHVVVVDSKTKKILFDQIYQGSEGGSPAPLNYIEEMNKKYMNQYTGQLFKNKPPVIFGFMFHSFGCNGIDFLNPEVDRIYVNCDNRH